MTRTGGPVRPSSVRGHLQALPRRGRAERGLVRRRPRVVPRPLRRERGGQEHAREDPGRPLRPRRRAGSSSTARPCASPARATRRAAGIAIVHQEPTFCRNLSVAENLCLAALPRRGPFVDRGGPARARPGHPRLGGPRPRRGPAGRAPDAGPAPAPADRGRGRRGRRASSSSTSPRAASASTRRPSSSRSSARVRAQGATCLYVSHRLREIFHLCDAVTVLRDGTHVATRPLAGLDERALVQMMIGRNLEAVTPEHLRKAPGPERLKVEGLTSPGRFQGVDLSVRAGEVVGPGRPRGRGPLRGRAGAVRPRPRGDRRHHRGRARRSRSSIPPTALRLGLGLVPEDRQAAGARAHAGRPHEHHPAHPRAPGPPRPGSQRARGGGAGHGPVRAAARPHSAHRLPGGRASPGATSRRSCSRAGWPRGAGS